MSQTLYRKYRPKNLSEIIGQSHVVQTLKNAIQRGRVGQAYLFTGPRGTGKTSIARILAKTINCEKPEKSNPCEKCPSCRLIGEGKSLDIIEIDAASNTGVDNIRELRETVALPATSLKFKVYIIDEVHMLSSGAFNALLKTLEEPPSHVVFILATTEIHKVPETIISRCQRFDFSRLPLEKIIEKLSLIAKSEKVKIEREALEMIALSAEGGMRDAESLMAQVMALEDKNITARETEEILGTVDRRFSFELAKLIFEKKTTQAVSKINNLSEKGYDLEIFAKTFLNYLRQLMLLSISPELEKHFSWEMPERQLKNSLELAGKTETSEIIKTINLFLEAKDKIWRAVLPQLPLEIAIIKATRTFPTPEKEESVKYEEESNGHRAENVKESNFAAPMKTEKTTDSNLKIGNLEIKQFGGENSGSIDGTAKDLDISKVKESWPQLLLDIKPFNHSLSVLLSACQITGIFGSSISLATPYEFYESRLSDAKNKLTIEEVFSKILGSKVSLKISVDKNLIPPQKDEDAGENVSEENSGTQDSLLTDAMEIMGGKVVEE